MGNDEKLWNASLTNIKLGYEEEAEHYSCLLCGKKVEKGIIYQAEGVFYEAEKYMKVHIEKKHGSVFDYLISLDKRITGLSDHQNKLLKLFYEGRSDADIQKILGIGSSSTIRNHRFVLKEKERQARIFLVMMELLKESSKKTPEYVLPHDTAKQVDERYIVTEEESEKIIKKYFPQGGEGPLKTFNIKEKSKLVVLKEIAKRFNQGQIYSEKEINEILVDVYEDYVMIRRYLVEYGFLDRKPDGSEYWLKKTAGKKVMEELERKKELTMQYKEMKTEAGVYQIKNKINGKILVVATPALKTINGKFFELKMGSHRNKELQEDWNKYGEEAFSVDVIEVLEEKKDGYFNKKEELKKLADKWIEKLQPFGDKGYNK